MNTGTLTKTEALELVDIVHLKWMLAGEGVHVHVERLQTDPGYATACLDAAARSTNNAVRQAAATLRERLAKTAAR